MTEPRILLGFELGEISSADAAAALAVARRIEAATIVAPPAAPAPDFTDRVMAALVDEPGPGSVGFVAPLRKLGVLAGFGASMRQAWATLERPGRPAFARAAALAYVLTVVAAGVSLAGAATFGAAGAFGLLGPASTHRPTPTPTPAPFVAPVITPHPVAEPTDELVTERSQEPSASADESEGPDDHSGGTGPEASDDHGGGTAPEASDERGDNSGPGGGDDSGPGESSPGASDDPGSTDDGGGSGSGGGSD
jgi:uncharacterized membrane protein YgcG